MPIEDSRQLFFLTIVAIVSLAFSLTNYLGGVEVRPEGPSWEIGEVTKGIWDRRSLQPDLFAEIKNKAQVLSQSAPAGVWQDVFALGRNGELYPKHSLFSAVVAVPFCGLFGEFGFWLLQQVFFLGLALATYFIVRNVTGEDLPWSVALSCCLLSQTIFHTYSFDYDLHGCALVIAGLALSRRWPSLGGLIMSLALFVRPAYGLVIFPLLFAWVFFQPPTKPWYRSLLGGALGLCGFLITNWVMWGSPWETAYSHLPMFYNGEMKVTPIPLGGDLRVLMSDWPRKLFGPNVGLVSFNLSLLALPLVLTALRNHWQRRFLFFCLLVGFLNFCYVFSFQWWFVSTHGNRFMLPSIFLYLIAFATFIGRYEIRLRNKAPS